MKKNIVICVLAAFFLCSLYGSARAADKMPGRTASLVNDYAGVIDSGTKEGLEKELRALERGKGVELIITTFQSLNGRNFEKFVLEYTPKWRKSPLLENDIRIHLMLAPAERKIRVGVGRGLQKIITPEVVDSILHDEMVPEFSKGDYASGLKKGAEEIIRKLDESKIPINNLPFNVGNVLILLFIVIMVFIIIQRI